MADCPGVLHLAEMVDGGLARLRAPGGVLTAAEVMAFAEAAERFGSGVVDLTNRANLQIRGLRPDAGVALAEALSAAGFRFFGEADRRRNILVDPFSSLDPTEVRDLRPLAARLDEALVSAPWIGRLSPKFSFVLDGGGASGVSAIPSDVVALANAAGLVIAAGGCAVAVETEAHAIAAMCAVAETAAAKGGDRRAADLDAPSLRAALGPTARDVTPPNRQLEPRLDVLPRPGEGTCAISLLVPVGRLDAAMLRFLADAAARSGDGRLRLAPWSAVVLAGLAEDAYAELAARAEAVGFTPVEVAKRLAVVACAGAPACARAREPAKALAAEILRLAASDRRLLPPTPRRLHLSACGKGCAGSAPADLLLLGDATRPGWTVHADAAPRSPGAAIGKLDAPTPEALLALLAR